MPWLSTSTVKKGIGGFASEEHQMWLQTEELHKSNTALPKVLIPHSCRLTHSVLLVDWTRQLKKDVSCWICFKFDLVPHHIHGIYSQTALPPQL